MNLLWVFAFANNIFAILAVEYEGRELSYSPEANENLKSGFSWGIPNQRFIQVRNHLLVGRNS